MIFVSRETEHLKYYMSKDDKGHYYYQIWEKDNNETPIALYDGAGTLHLQDRFPKNEKDYKYFKEFCDVIIDIKDMKDQGMF